MSVGTGITHRVTLIPGDGTGPELTAATVRVLEATGLAFDWDVQQVGAAASPTTASDDGGTAAG